VRASARAPAPDYLRRANRATAASWDLFAAHRARLTSLLCTLCGTGVDRLAIVGAGNCNDLDLPRLLEKAATIQLLDLDGEALARGVTQQSCAGVPRIELLAGVDVTSADDVLTGCDVILSACLLSQLILPLVDRFGAGDPRLLERVQRIRDGHLRFLTRQLRPGGRGLLAIDFVSSDTCPALIDAPDAAMEALAVAALRDRNFFSGTNPLVIQKRLGALVRPSVTNVRLLKPWRWRISKTRALLVSALTFERASA
jgi:hypothetical protein